MIKFYNGRIFTYKLAQEVYEINNVGFQHELCKADREYFSQTREDLLMLIACSLML